MANHSQEEIKMNLQLIAEGEPGGDSTGELSTGPATEITGEQQGEPAGEPAREPEEQPSAPPPKIKVKYNHQEIEVPYEEAIMHIQKGMNYEKAIERARQEAAKEAEQRARDAIIAEMGYTWRGKPITTEAEYRQALKEKEIEDKIRMQYSNLPEEIIEEILENRRFREETLAERKAREEAERKAQEQRDFEARKTAMFNEFFEEFPEYDNEDKWGQRRAQISRCAGKIQP